MPGVWQAPGDESVPLRRVALGFCIRLHHALAHASEKKMGYIENIVVESIFIGANLSAVVEDLESLYR